MREKSRTRSRWSLTLAAVTGLAAAGVAGPAQAAVPAAANTWSGLMYRSITAGPQAAQLRAGLAGQQTAFAARVADVSAAKVADQNAQALLAAAITADTTARTQLATAGTAYLTAKKTLAKVSAQKPRSAAAVTRAQTAVAAALKTVNLRKASAQLAATTLTNARTQARTATAGLTSAIAAWKAASVAVQVTQQKIAALGTAPAYAAQAAAISRDVVTQVRPGFTIADTTSVYGVTVHKSISFAFKHLVDDAKADGIVLSGGGFRTTQRQIELRTINGCPDVWTAPASSCRVPTAIPGRSLHELGLAIDVTTGGKALTAKSPAFAWMVAHADGYGFVNLPSEPWHWSITGG